MRQRCWISVIALSALDKKEDTVQIRKKKVKVVSKLFRYNLKTVEFNKEGDRDYR